jgi:RimJ/RimL family protein N-acetyltransferase
VGSFLHRVRLLRASALENPVVADERTTPRLLLRSYRTDDADDWLAIENDATIRKGLGWPVRTWRQALRHLRARTHHTVLRHSGDLLVLAIEYQGTVIGDVSLHLRAVPAATRSVEIGWLLRSGFSGHGFATEAADRLLDVAFEEVGASIVSAVVRNGNEASATLALRLGFRPAARRCGTTTYVLSREDRLHGTSHTDAVSRPHRTVAVSDIVSPRSRWRARS